MKTENINEATLSERERIALAILAGLADGQIAALKHTMHLGAPAVVGPQTLAAFVALCRDRGLDLSPAGVLAFKQARHLGEGDTIGKTTAAAYFAALDKPPVGFTIPGARQVNAEGLRLIKNYEGFRERAYLCPAGVWTIGYGHTGGVNEGDTVTREEAERLLRSDLRHAEGAVSRLIRVPLTDNEFSALVSFVYNCGAGALQTSTMRAHLNGGRRLAAADEFWRWCQAGGRKLPGLVRRRADERALFLKR